MDTVHRTLDGSWAVCQGDDCELLFHLPNFEVSQAKNMPLDMLLPLLNAAQPSSGRYSINGQLAECWLRPLRPPNEWYQELHRDYDLPARVFDSGRLDWYQDDLLHRDGDRPAIIRPDGTQEWYQRGKRHRGDWKPAVIRTNGIREYWINGKHVTVKEIRRLQAEAEA